MKWNGAQWAESYSTWIRDCLRGVLCDRKEQSEVRAMWVCSEWSGVKWNGRNECRESCKGQKACTEADVVNCRKCDKLRSTWRAATLVMSAASFREHYKCCLAWHLFLRNKEAEVRFTWGLKGAAWIFYSKSKVSYKRVGSKSKRFQTYEIRNRCQLI